MHKCVSLHHKKRTKTKEMKATIANLKANREQIIETLIELFGKENLVSKMTSLKNHVELSERFDEDKEVEDFIEYMRLSVPSRRKTSKSAEMIAEIAERRGERWDSKKQMFVKF